MAFSDPANTEAFTCKHVTSGRRPILFVSHDQDDGAWQFLCNVGEHELSDLQIVTLGQVVQRDPSVDELGDLPLGQVATRKNLESSWVRAQG